MTRHITVFGRPWCDCQTSPKLFNLPPDADPVYIADAMFDLTRKASEQGVFIICMNSRPADEDAVKFLNDNGIPAVLTDGPCPTLRQEDYE